MGNVPVTKGGTVQLRGIHFPVENIRAAMMETGGVPVSDRQLNNVLDMVMQSQTVDGGDTPKALSVEAIPDQWFIPVKITLHLPGIDSVPADCWIYFAVPKKTIFNA